MMNTPELRAECAEHLRAGLKRAAQMTAFVGFDGFVDEILHVVDKRANAENFQRLPTIASLAVRLAGAAGKSTNIELVNQVTKLGGNGPIMANALASFGLKVSYLGTLGYPTLHPIFSGFAERAQVFSIADAGHTDALEFEDGKIMLGKHYPLKELNWPNIVERFGKEKLAVRMANSDLLGFVNWTMLPYLSDVWAAMLAEICPAIQGPRRKLFFDLADPEKRTRADIARALKLIVEFEQYFDVVLGLNEKEAYEIGEVLNIKTPVESTPETISVLCAAINQQLSVNTVVVHPVTYALAASGGKVSLVRGPYIPKPLITTGAGDHFNSGFCLGKLLGLDNQFAVLIGVATSGFYVRSALSPTIPDLIQILTHWPEA